MAHGKRRLDTAEKRLIKLQSMSCTAPEGTCWEARRPKKARACGCSVSWDEECNGGKHQPGNQNGDPFRRIGWNVLPSWG
jgi:hypothetical protein